MKKKRLNIEKERKARNGLMWVHIPSMNYRQSSGVEYRGKYMTREEYRTMIIRRKLAEGE